MLKNSSKEYHQILENAIRVIRKQQIIFIQPFITVIYSLADIPVVEKHTIYLLIAIKIKNY